MALQYLTSGKLLIKTVGGLDTLMDECCCEEENFEYEPCSDGYCVEFWTAWYNCDTDVAFYPGGGGFVGTTCYSVEDCLEWGATGWAYNLQAGIFCKIGIGVCTDVPCSNIGGSCGASPTLPAPALPTSPPRGFSTDCCE